MKTREHKGNSIIAFPNEYISIDIETTGLDFGYDEIIEISAILVRNGATVDQYSSLVKPHHSHAFLTLSEINKLGFNCFSEMPEDLEKEFFETHLIPQFIESLTGISNSELLNAPYIESILPDLSSFLGTHILVGHNVHFDINFLYDAFENAGLYLKNDFVDTMRISKKLLPELPHHRLRDLVNQYKISQDCAHRAYADASATLQCFEAMKTDIAQTYGIDNFIEQFFVHVRRTYKDILSSMSPEDNNIDTTNPIYGKTVVFTGALTSMSRKDAFQIVLNLGGIPSDNMNKKTNYLIVGNEDFAKSVKNGKTSKMLKAEKYKEQGCDIEVLSEDTFLQIIE